MVVLQCPSCSVHRYNLEVLVGQCKGSAKVGSSRLNREVFSDAVGKGSRLKIIHLKFYTKTFVETHRGHLVGHRFLAEPTDPKRWRCRQNKDITSILGQDDIWQEKHQKINPTSEPKLNKASELSVFQCVNIKEKGQVAGLSNSPEVSALNWCEFVTRDVDDSYISPSNLHHEVTDVGDRKAELFDRFLPYHLVPPRPPKPRRGRSGSPQANGEKGSSWYIHLSRRIN